MFVWWRGGQISWVLCNREMERLIVCLVRRGVEISWVFL